MALITEITTSKVSLGELAADTVFTCKQGHIGLTTDDAADDNTNGPHDYFDLHIGMRVVISSGQTVKYRKFGTADAVLHHMPL
jgi:hypothetical protein